LVDLKRIDIVRTFALRGIKRGGLETHPTDGVETSFV
jgi:hypothetical protein